MGAAPDVGVADEAHCGVEDPLLPGGQLRQRERVCGIRCVLGFPSAEAQHLRDRVRRFRARHGTAREKLEVVVLRRVVRAQAEEAGNGLGAETGRDAQPGITCAREDGRGGIRQLQRLHEPRIELRHGDGGSRVCGRLDGLLRQAGDESGELALREQIVGAEGRNALRHQLVGDDQLDLGLRPGLRGQTGALLAHAAAVADP